MLDEADSALIIGDPALHIDPQASPFDVYDLGREWIEMTGLPMVFAVWAGPREICDAAKSQRPFASLALSGCAAWSGSPPLKRRRAVCRWIWCGGI